MHIHVLDYCCYIMVMLHTQQFRKKQPHEMLTLERGGGGGGGGGGQGPLT